MGEEELTSGLRSAASVCGPLSSVLLARFAVSFLDTLLPPPPSFLQDRMALDAVHIRSAPFRRGLGSQRSNLKGGAQDQGWSSSELDLTTCAYVDDGLDDYDAWRIYKTGEAASRRAIGTSSSTFKSIRFVRATKLSLDAIELHDSLGQKRFQEEEDRKEEDQDALLEDTYKIGLVISEGCEAHPAAQFQVEPTENPLISQTEQVSSGAQSNMSAFYASLVQKMRAPPYAHRQPSHRSESTHLKAKRSRTISSRPEEWFISRAARRWDSSQATAPEPLGSSYDLTATHCLVCGAALPAPRTVASLREHRSTLAHQLAADARRPPPKFGSKVGTAPPVTAKASRVVQQHEHLTQLALSPGNRGYALLSRMGWEAGRALGREEWEATQEDMDDDLTARDGGEMGDRDTNDAIDLVSPEPDDQLSRAGRSADAAIEVDSDTSGFSSDENENEAQPPGSGTESEWLTHLAQISQISGVPPRPSPASNYKPNNVPSSRPSTSSAHTSQRTSRGALLAPLTIEYKSDRRGLGLSPLPAPPSAQPRVRLRNHTELRHEELERLGRRKKKSRKEMADEQRRDLGRIRESLR